MRNNINAGTPQVCCVAVRSGRENFEIKPAFKPEYSKWNQLAQLAGYTGRVFRIDIWLAKTDAARDVTLRGAAHLYVRVCLCVLCECMCCIHKRWHNSIGEKANEFGYVTSERACAPKFALNWQNFLRNIRMRFAQCGRD